MSDLVGYRARWLVSVAPVLAAVGCGDDGGGGPVDAGGDRGAPGQVTVVALVAATPVAGVPVYFQDYPEHVVAPVVTDATGRVTAEVATGGVVTAILPSSGSLRGGAALVGELHTFVGVEPGDELVVGDLFAQASGRSIDVVVPAEARSTLYRVDTPCAAATIGLLEPATAPVTIAVDLAGCGAVTDVAVLARAPGVDKVMTALAAPVVDGQPIALTGPWAAPHRAQVVVTGAPASGPRLSVEQALWTARGKVATARVEVTSSGGRASADLDVAWAPGPELAHWTMVGLPSVGGGAAVVTEWGPHDGAHTVELSGRLLPSIAGAPSYSIARRAVTWTETGAGAAVDHAIAELLVNRPGDGQWSWQVVGPRDGTRLPLPSLPTDQHDWTPRAGDVVGVGTLTLAAHSGGYDGARGTALLVAEPRPRGAGGWEIFDTRSE